MYLESLSVTQLRVFEQAEIKLWHPLRKDEPSAPKLRNVNLLLGDNGAGKSTLLRAMALAALGPLAEKFAVSMMVRRHRQPQATAKGSRRSALAASLATGMAEIEARGLMTAQDRKAIKPPKTGRPKALRCGVAIELNGEEEFVRPRHSSPQDWQPIMTAGSAAFLVVGYGATRRMDTDPSSPSPQQRQKNMPIRHQRVASLFYDSYTLVGPQNWLGEWQHKNPGRFSQVLTLLNSVLPEGLELTKEKSASDEFLFSQHGALVPYSALSDGPKAFIGWVMDLLYHVNFGCPSGWTLKENCGLVLVDEVDLHLHPEWQRTAIPKLSVAFPNLQFVFTSHSPLIVGSLEAANIWVCSPNATTGAAQVAQPNIGVHGLNSDHILLTPYFGLQSSRAEPKRKQLDDLAAQSERGIPGKALEFLRQLVEPLEQATTTKPAAATAKRTVKRGTKKATTQPAAKSARTAARK